MKKIKNNHKKSIIKKIGIKLIRKIGFEVIDQNNLTIPTSNKKINDNLSILNKRIITLPLGEVKITRKINSFLVVFRSFTNQTKLLQQNKKRLFEKEKQEYTFRSLKSICNNLIQAKKYFKSVNFFLKIIDDNSSSKVVNKLKKIAKKSSVNFELTNLEIEKYSKKMKFKNSPRMTAHNCHIFQSKEFAVKSDYDLIYFVEDDYIHDENAFIEMIYSYQKFSSQLKEDVVLCPSDYPYLYQKFDYTKILIGSKKHWRKIDQSLCTYLISKKILVKYWPYYEEMFLNNFNPYEKPLHKLYAIMNCFSPMPSLAIHVTNFNSIYGLSPLVNWLKFWNINKY